MRVLLAHGLSRTPVSFALLARRLRRAGHRPEMFAWFAIAEPHERILGRLVTRLQQLAAEGEPVGLVGHSMGGLLLRQALARVPGLKVRHFVMLGVPNRRPRLADKASSWWTYRFLTRDVGRRLADPAWFESLPPLRVPYTIGAGTRGWRGTAGPFPGEPNDGIVAVSETLVCPQDKPVELPVLHTFMMNHRETTRLVLDALGPREEIQA
jgi:pimeloyl-ACP methyl ester carboxylesterase